MWIKLDNDLLNLDHVIRIRFATGWKNGAEELVAELEGWVKGEVQVFTRYRGAAARKLQDCLTAPVNKSRDVFATAPELSRAMSNTLHDVQLP